MEESANIARSKPSTLQSCDQCRKKKSRCDSALPCHRCARLGFACSYTREPRKRGPPKGTKSTIHQRLKNLETFARTLGVDPSNPNSIEIAVAASGLVSVNAHHNGSIPRGLHEEGQGLVPPQFVEDHVSGFTNLPIPTLAVCPPTPESLSSDNFGRAASPRSRSRSPAPSIPGLPSPSCDPHALNFHLLEQFFRDIHPSFPIVSKSRLFRDIGNGESLPLDLKLLVTVLQALGNPRVGDCAAFKDMASLCTRVPTLRTAQSMLAASLYSAQFGVIGIAGADCLLAQGICIARQLGLCKPSRQQRSSSRFENDLIADEIEERQLVWGMAYCLDKWFAVNLDRSAMMSSDEVEHLDTTIKNTLLLNLHTALHDAHVLSYGNPRDPALLRSRILEELSRQQRSLNIPDFNQPARCSLYALTAVWAGEDLVNVTRVIIPALKEALRNADPSGYVSLGPPFTNLSVYHFANRLLESRQASPTIHDDLTTIVAALVGNATRWKVGEPLAKELAGLWMRGVNGN
ncbi:hypothetical protein M427DRAFT_65386 [Gonapodya prolifera JEL478]|uniref:Zn(2)-C6 fungal-type domain-containing protein n=1 Tax=Gonapodya prolifera (strain JEL478) TaxID=1344416 RepID=A0A139B137_GONPJ|nr:hypothetical protein M427DRAFT_65386 [Gonapodya prolifera JEL478]|eukprot:KXS22415.1 hypothetical protein M427DRAFT_65386 [Gonapodya prolifera JEL478]